MKEKKYVIKIVDMSFPSLKAFMILTVKQEFFFLMAKKIYNARENKKGSYTTVK